LELLNFNSNIFTGIKLAIIHLISHLVQVTEGVIVGREGIASVIGKLSQPFALPQIPINKKSGGSSSALGTEQPFGFLLKLPSALGTDFFCPYAALHAEIVARLAVQEQAFSKFIQVLKREFLPIRGELSL
jgi:hypothetical protein